MDAERLERAARALLGIRDFEWSGHAEVDGHRGFLQACPACGGLRPDMAPRSLKNLHGHGKRCPLVALRAALAAQPAQAGAYHVVAWAEVHESTGGRHHAAMLMRGEDIIGDFFDPNQAQAACDALNAAEQPAQAGEAVAWGVRRVRTGIIVAAEITKDAAVERASDLTRTLQEEFSTDGHGIPLYGAPSRPGGA